MRTSWLYVPPAATLLAFALWSNGRPDHDALFAILQNNCLIADIKSAPHPCVKVDLNHKFVILEGAPSKRHYLLLPITNLSGLESTSLVDRNIPNFFEYAWENRGLLRGTNVRPLMDTDVVLAVNSRWSRAHDHLQIHISCIKANVRARLDEIEHIDMKMWTALPRGLEGHAYWARRVTFPQFQQTNVFSLLAYGLPGAVADMDKYALAMTVSRSGDPILLATKLDLLDLNLASAQELQDQECVVAGDTPTT